MTLKLCLSASCAALLWAVPASATELATYKPAMKVSGTIRSFGYSLGGLLPIWEAGFKTFHPDVTFADTFPSGDAAIAGLVTGVADIGPQGRELELIENLVFFETFKYMPTAVAVATGAYDVDGASNALVVFVNKENPIRKLTMKQLDGIFGAERTGTFHGFKWTLESGRSAKDDIRTWGQLGLTGEWAEKPIQTYGHSPSGTTNFFQIAVLDNSDKWNPNYKEYVETGGKMISDSDKATQAGGLQHMLKDLLPQDKYGIAWSVLPQAKGAEGIAKLDIAPGDTDHYVAPSRENVAARVYPLTRTIYFYLNRKPGQPLDPKVREFIRYVLSKDGQDATTKAGKYLALPVATAAAEAAKLD